ncbi:MAG TPA: hypothetical protein VJ111_02050 [Chitinophagaceae bacterium]|nr:hypothetical protein [Chitinophagaceae bacterium]
MSSLQNKMYNQEVIPPIHTWEKIAAALEEAHLQNEFPSRLYNIEVVPPATAWQKIIVNLDDKQIQNEFPSRLFNMEVAPPVTAWEKVAAGLYTTTKLADTPIRRLSPIFRYAAAAIFIGAVAYGVIRLSINTNNKEGSTVLATDRKDSSRADKTKIADTGKTQTPGIKANQTEDEMLEKSKNLAARSDKRAKKTARTIRSSARTAGENNEAETDADLSQSIYAYADHIPDISDRYVMLMTPDGNIIRMSKKWGDLLCCVSGEEQDADCKYQLKKWQHPR